MTNRNRKASTRYRGLYSYDTNDGKRWGVAVNADPDWRSGARRQIRKHGFRTQEEARNWQVAFQDKRRRGDILEPSMMPLGKWMDEWLGGRVDIKPTTRRMYLAHFGWLADLQPIPLSRLTPQTIENALNRLVGDRHRASSVANARQSLSTCLRAAVRLGLLATNPSADAKAPAGERVKPVALSATQVQQLLSATENDGQWHILWRFALESCMRIGELLELRWADIDLEAGAATVARNQSEGDAAGTWVVSTPKTANSLRAIALSPELVTVMRRHRLSQVEQSIRRGAGWTDTNLVFPDERGNWLRRMRIQRQLASACLKANVPRLTPHGLRHTGGSIAYLSGVDIKTISERMGHRDVMTTYRIYVHTDTGHHRRVADQIGRLFGGQNAVEKSG